MTGIILLNLGGPDSLDAVRPFLYNLFSDREIIRLGPSILQKPIAWLISSLRYKKTQSYYRLIGGRSPIREITAAEAAALEEFLNSSSPAGEKAYRVFVGMRYWNPRISETLKEISAAGITKVVALGLYPHYSVATTGSSLSELKKQASALSLEIFPVMSWYDHPAYINALAEKIRKGVAEIGQDSAVHLLYSAHSLPKKFIDEGDPYVEHIEKTIKAVSRIIDLPYSLAYQSKSGPVEWLSPSTEETIENLAAAGVKNLLVVPVSFVSDHIETLYEIDILYKRMAEQYGVTLRRTESLNTSPQFIRALAEISLKAEQEAGWKK